MAMVTIQEARATLPDLIHKLAPGDALVITENNRPVAKLVSELPQAGAQAASAAWPRQRANHHPFGR